MKSVEMLVVSDLCAECTLVTAYTTIELQQQADAVNVAANTIRLLVVGHMTTH